MTEPRTLREAELLPAGDGVEPCKLDDPVLSAGAVLLLHRTLDQLPTPEV